MDGRRCSSDRQIIYPFDQVTKLPTIKWAAEMPPFFIGEKGACFLFCLYFGRKDEKNRRKVMIVLVEKGRWILYSVYNLKIG